MQRIVPAIVVVSIFSLTGCSFSKLSPATQDVMHLTLSGSVHGGQQPVAGARVFVFQANNTGYGNGSVDLIGNSPAGPGLALLQGGGKDTAYNAYYVSTNASGGFSVSGDYLCSGTGPVYLLATQGNPGLGVGQNNTAIAELAVLGPCANGSTLSGSLQVSISEVSTVAGVYALAGFMTAPNAISSNGAKSSLSQTGLSNATGTALSLTNLAAGSTLATTAAGGMVPVSKINLLADVLAACINSAGPGSTTCMSLFGAATSDGTASGTKPTETVTALLNIAHHPAVNIATLYGLASSAAPYQPMPATQPTDLTLTVGFPISYESLSAPNPVPYGLNPNVPTIDAVGNIVIPGNVGASGITFIKNYLGMDVANSGTSTILYPNIWAIDRNGFGWSGNSPTFTPSGIFSRLAVASGGITVFDNFSGYSSDAAIDASGNILVAAKTAGGVYQFNSAGALSSIVDTTYTPTAVAADTSRRFELSSGVSTIIINGQQNPVGGALPSPNSLAVDSSDSVWITNGNSTLSKFNCVGFSLQSGCQLSSPSGGFSGGGLSFDTSSYAYVPVVMDGASNPFIPNYSGKSISQFSNAGGAVSPDTTGFQTGCNSKGLAVDGSGNVWVTCDNSAATPNFNSLIEFIGLATPVATPVLPNQVGVRP